MSVLSKIKRSVSQMAASPDPSHLTTSYCKQCGRRTRWIAHLGRGYFRCVECHEGPSEEA
jgi:tRNA(Ile2) C34 agmatinyltransferase TiaS